MPSARLNVTQYLLCQYCGWTRECGYKSDVAAFVCRTCGHEIKEHDLKPRDRNAGLAGAEAVDAAQKAEREAHQFLSRS